MSIQENDLVLSWLDRASTEQETAYPLADRNLPMLASYAQQGMWLADVIAAEADKSSVVQHAFRLSGPLNTTALEQAFNAILSRHEAWRTGFVERQGNLYQEVASEEKFDFAVEDLAKDPDALTKRIIEVYRTPMNLTLGQLVRARLFTLGKEHHVLLVTIHHIAFDGWSLDVLQYELEALYAAACMLPKNSSIEDLLDAADLPELEIQYLDFAVWQRNQVESGACAVALAYWSQYLAGAPNVLALPLDRMPPTVRSSAGDRISFTLEPALKSKLDKFAAKRSTTPFCIQLTVFMLILARWSKQHDFVLGVTLAGRKTQETEGLLGFFVNVLPIRVALQSHQHFDQVLSKVRQDLLAMHDYDEVPLEYLLEHLCVARSAANKPLIQVTVASHQNLTQPLRLDGLEVSYIPPIDLDVQEDMTLYFTSSGDEVQGHLAYSTDLFSRAVLEPQIHQYLDLLNLVCDSSEQTLLELGLSLENPAKVPVSASDVDEDYGEIDAEIEAVLLEVWSEIFPRQVLSRDSNFFTIGGTSLSALRTCSRIGNALRIRVPVRLLFENSSVKGLAVAVKRILQLPLAAA